jgi:serine/threonine protein phosphatase PrpC
MMSGSEDTGHADRAVPDPAVSDAMPDLASPGDTTVAAEVLTRNRRWSGSGLDPFVVGEPGRAAMEVIPQAVTVPFGRPDTAIDHGVIGRLEVRAASVRGLASRYSGITRQDEYCLGTDKDRRWLVAAVADGVSAGRHSQIAATIAARHGCQLLADQLAHDPPTRIDWHQTVKAVAQVIIREGTKLLAADSSPSGPTARDVAAVMATTVAYAIIATSPGEGGFELHVFGVGDTSAWLLDDQSGWRLLAGGKDRSDELASSQTLALPYLPGVSVLAVQKCLKPGSAFLMVSDGIGDPIGDASGDVGAFLAEVWREPPQPLTFAAQVCFARRGFDDDRTAVAVWPQQ